MFAETADVFCVYIRAHIGAFYQSVKKYLLLFTQMLF